MLFNFEDQFDLIKKNTVHELYVPNAAQEDYNNKDKRLLIIDLFQPNIYIYDQSFLIP